MTDEHGRRIDEVDPEECLALLASHEVGRIGINAAAGPLVYPVNYALVEGVIVVRTAAAGRLVEAVDHRNIAFQVDDIDRMSRSGWSVLVHCLAEALAPGHSAAQDAATRASGATPWAPGRDGAWLRLIPQSISGRRITPADDAFFPPGAYL